MRQIEYRAVVSEINSRKMKKGPCIAHLQNKFPGYSEDTFVSIYSQLWQRKIKKDFYKYHRRDKVERFIYQYNVYFAEKRKEGFISRLADEIEFPPTLLARLFLEEFMKSSLNLDRETVPKSVISECIKDPKEIPDPVLSREVEVCVMNDELCGPNIELIKREIGLKYEKLLHDFLTEKDIAYYHEDVLRKEGYDKTPDFKLVVPIVVKNHVIHWIESKALFGDEESHTGYLEKQFWSYTNRFGPGLVIYWFGFIDELDVNLERGVMLDDKFPEEILTFESLLDEEHENFSIAL